VRRAEDVLVRVEDLVQAARSAGQPLSGRLRLGVIPTIAPFLLPRALPVLRERFPRLRLFLREDLTSKLIAGLKSGALDAALIALPYDVAGLETAEVRRDELMAAAPRDHPLAHQSVVDCDAMEAEDVILLEDGHCLRDHALAACNLDAVRGDGGGFAATSLHTLVQMVGSGLGVTLLPAMAVEAGLAEQADVVVRPLRHEVPHRDIVIAWRRGSSREAEARLLAETLRGI
jgi:LysR family hydrogen peroxide-inducible transcriptional activator